MISIGAVEQVAVIPTQTQNTYEKSVGHNKEDSDKRRITLSSEKC